jgi:hypothetical protein
MLPAALHWGAASLTHCPNGNGDGQSLYAIHTEQCDRVSQRAYSRWESEQRRICEE